MSTGSATPARAARPALRGLLVERLEPMFFPPVLEREVPGDPQQEGAQRPAERIEPVRISQKPDERVLGDVLRRGR